MRFNAKQLHQMSNSVRSNALRAVRSAMSGHIGIVLGASDIITTIYANFLRRGRDKFVLSAGHGSAMLYSVLKLSGYDVEDLETFRKIGGLPGHPEYGTDGVSATTGPLGQGVGNAVGMAVAEKIKKSDGVIYCLCSDGDLMEGVAQESIVFAGIYRLNNLVLLWDDNKISIDGAALTDIDVVARMRAAGWRTVTVDGNNFGALNRALSRAGTGTRPTFIQCKTQIGRGSSLAGDARAHGLALGASELSSLIEKYTSSTGEKLWADVARDAPAKYVQNPLDVAVENISAPDAPTDISTRELSGMYLNALISGGVRLIGGSADLSASTNARVASHHDIMPGRFAGNFVNYGVREHAMGAIMNGLAFAGMRPYGSTFLAFSDYMRASIRLAALSGLPVIYVFTHDSVAVGEDGPTHQPVEQLASLRLIPNLNVFRPCNMTEVVYAWRAAIEDTNHPSCIILSRQKIKQIPTPRSKIKDVLRGGYVIRAARGRTVSATIIATGSEVPLAIDVASRLGASVQVVSMPNVAAFCAQSAIYKRKILRGRVIAIEAASTAPWFAIADVVFGIDEFGMSGAGSAVYSACGFDADSIASEIKGIIGGK
ncbi:MAG: transketolase [Alphaproteobacteria bacterium]|nr:transketolase [Alphaproteobacteria bacterium]